MIHEEEEDIGRGEKSFDGFVLKKDCVGKKGGEITMQRKMEGHLKLRRRAGQIGLSCVRRDAGVTAKIDGIHPIHHC